MSRLPFIGVLLAASVAVTAPVTAHAYTYDKVAILTFSGAVQVPGATLTAGSYRFRLTNAETGRSVLQVIGEDGAKVYAMFLTMPDSRRSVTHEPAVTFKETPAGVPPAVRSLFYAGEYRGYEFVYAKAPALVADDTAPQPAITYTPLPRVFEAEPIVEPDAEIVAALPAAAAPLPYAPAELPRTGTEAPLLALAGLTSLLAGAALGLRRHHR